MKNYLDFANTIASTFEAAKKIPTPDAQHAPKNAAEIFGNPALPTDKSSADNILIFAPHPDDECITGLLPLRLMREHGAHVTNVAITLGSNVERRGERKIELQNACNFLGWELEICGDPDNGLVSINPKTRADNPNYWSICVEKLAAIIEEKKPTIIFAPHPDDWNATHIGTALLARDAVRKADWCGTFVETEYWGGLKKANLMVEARSEHVATLITALAFHKKEVERNDYHLRLPAWMCDNVRRGAELVGGAGAPAPEYTFATLYNVIQIPTKHTLPPAISALLNTTPKA